MRIKAVIRHDNEAENRNFPGVPAAPTSAVAAAYVKKIVDDPVKGAVVTITDEDLTPVPSKK